MKKNSIIGEFLDEHWSKNFINDLLTSEPIFLSSKTLEYLKTYNEAPHNSQNTKQLWNNLLIDSVCLLKLNDSREFIYKELKKDSSLFNEKQFDEIRETSSYGIDELGKYLDDFVDFEAVLYGSDNHYRDHINHVIQVWIVGLGIIQNHLIELNDKYSVLYEFDFHYMIPDTYSETHLYISKSELWSIWTIISLCHDLGYPIEKSSKINKKTKKIIDHFGNIQFTELDYNFSILNTFLVEKFLDIVSSKVYSDSEDISTIKKEEKKEYTYKTSIQTKYRDKFAKSLEDYKHGIFSSLLLFKSLTYFLETDYYLGDKPLDEEDARQFYIRKEILRSIAGHTCPKLYHIKLNSLSFLLILCDELQEWNRPNFSSYIDNLIKNDPKVKIVELSFPDKNTENYQKIHIEMKYESPDAKNKEDYLVKNKYKTMHYLLRSAKEDYNRNVYFRWDIYLSDIKYSYIFNSRDKVFEQVKFKKFDFQGKEIDFKLYEETKK